MITTESPSTPANRTARRWSQLPEQLEQQHFGVMLAVGGAVALLLLVVFIGVLQGQVQRSEMRRAQHMLAAAPAQGAVVPAVVVVARYGR